ncbi:MAG: ATP-binding cassette domain-containing protein [Candidatus Latescibacteria bacterium]|nr:ATP-binding cassette domain-containing protein [Candidatus Latescibacterota bacterium]
MSADGAVAKVRAEGLTKEYPGTLALDNVSVDFWGGQVHALIGKNGAGKSTLVKILAGSVGPTRGSILVQGQAVELRSPQDAFAQGIATVYQELSLVPGLSVAENILLGRLPRRRWGVDWKAVEKRAREVLEQMGVDIDPAAPAASLGVAQQQIVEIAKAMSFAPAVLMLDEPTSALARHETEQLFKLVRQLAAQGVAIVYISHRLQELSQIADRVTVLRDGRLVDTVAMASTSSVEIVHMMFGEIVQQARPDDLAVGQRPVLQTRGLTRAGHFSDIDLTLYEGEILGLAGMLGSGRTELLRALFGAEPSDGGQIMVGDETIDRPTPHRMKELGLAFTSENRKEEALVLEHSIRANMCLASLGLIARWGWISRAGEQPLVDEHVERLQIKVADTEGRVGALSGGNQQKVVVANWLGTKPRIILFDEPTRGIDVQAKQQIFEVMWDLSRQGIACLFVSTELEELVEVCHRIVVIKHGRLAGQVDPGQLGADELYVRCMEE